MLPAEENIRKGARLDLAVEPDVPLAPYAGLQDPPGVGVGMEFSAAQKAAIYNANIAYYGTGEIISDQYLDDHNVWNPLMEMDSGALAHVDHITPKVDGGTDYYFNARVISAEENLQKGGGTGPRSASGPRSATTTPCRP